MASVSSQVGKVLKRSSLMEWSKSPSMTVLRKRLEHSGPAEAGRVTSVVQYLPNSNFPPHEHPDGEEIFVIDGIFSDASGDHPRGTYILNPEGFSHAPRSKEGCTLFVKLRQYPGLERRQIRIASTDESVWKEQGLLVDSCHVLPLYRPAAGDQQMEEMDLVRVPENGEFHLPPQPNGVEIFLVQGDHVVIISPESGSADELDAAAWLKVESTSDPMLLCNKSNAPCLVYVKRNHLNSENYNK